MKRKASLQENRSRFIQRKFSRYKIARNFAFPFILALIALAGQRFLLHSQITGQDSYKLNVVSTVSSTDAYLYFVLKTPEGFILARAHENANHAPAETPQKIASFGDAFGQTIADGVLSMQRSPDGRYLAIDGTRSDCEFVWIFDTLKRTLVQRPVQASGTFLRWLPGSSGVFLYRPIFPVGPDAPMNDGDWNPGLWRVDAATGEHTNLTLAMPSAFVVDATVSPDGKTILYSTTEGIGTGSTIWSIDSNGENQRRLLQLDDEAQSIAGQFTWSPDGRSVAYQRLTDSPTPFLAAGIWVMDSQGGQQHYLAQGDGGHGFAMNWSPDGRSLAYVARTNLQENLANLRLQSLKSAVEIVNVSTGQKHMLAGPVQTGMQINVNPKWDADGSHITFTAFNPLNPAIGGTPGYWSAEVNSSGISPSATRLTSPLSHVVAFE